MIRLKLFDLVISEEEQSAFERACKSANDYMEKLGKSIGRTARTGGEYYEPGSRPNDNEDWIPELTALEYAHISMHRLRQLATEGSVRRRVYKRKGKRIFYEYSVKDIDDFINHE